MRTPPVGIAAIRDLYGDPRPLILADGGISHRWEWRMVPVIMPGPLKLGWDEKMVDKIRVNQNIIEVVARLFAAWSKDDLWKHVQTFDGSYVWRTKRGSPFLSMHAYGGAMDFNAATNPMGEKGDMHPRLVEVAENLGWTWGGRFRNPDPMHFQWGSGY